jgi:hypothetical protein
MVLPSPIVIVIAIVSTPIHLIIVKDGYLGLVSRIGYLSVLYIIPIIVKGSYLESIA